MATSMQVEPETSVERALQQIDVIEMEGEEEGDPLEGLGNKEITEIYNRLTPGDRQLFRQFKKFHKLHYELYGHDTPSYQLVHGIIKEMFSGIPAKDAEVITAARAEILAAGSIYSATWYFGGRHQTRCEAAQKNGNLLLGEAGSPSHGGSA